ncbi:MAG: hypothetical protein B6226_01445, partial [Candidatus Cloacimonetes bacterium 4572_65]
MMKIMDPNSLKYDKELLLENRELMMLVYRHMFYSRRKVNIFKKFIKSYQNLEKVTKLKNAQHEAVNKKEITRYVKNLGKAYDYILKMILDKQQFQGHSDVIALHAFVDPESFARNPSNYRKTIVKYGNFYAAEPNRIY